MNTNYAIELRDIYLPNIQLTVLVKDFDITKSGYYKVYPEVMVLIYELTHEALEIACEPSLDSQAKRPFTDFEILAIKQVGPQGITDDAPGGRLIYLSTSLSEELVDA